MTAGLTKRDRLTRVAAGQAVDRLPISMWRHFHAEETDAVALARRLAQWHRRFDFDFCKINVRAQYHGEAWGNRYEYYGADHRKPALAASVIDAPRDFANLRPADPRGWPFSEMIETVRLLRADLGPDEVLLMTVFTPLAVAAEIAGGSERLIFALREAPAAAHRGLRAITDTFRDFVAQLLDEGVDGLFFATTETATTIYLTSEQYEEFGRPYDLEVLEVADRAFFNVLHVCGARAFIRQLADYPVRGLHWDTSTGDNPTLAGLLAAADRKALLCGLSRGPFARRGGAMTLLNELAALRQELGPRAFVVAPGCTIPTETLDENIDALCRAARS